MRFILIHKNDPHTEAGEKPTPELIQKMGAFIGEHAQNGTFLEGEGLGASATRTRLTFENGTATIVHGPYRGERELPGAMLLLSVKTREEAIGWAERYGKILGDGEIELGPLHEPWDLGFGEKPVDAPLRVLLLEKELGDRTTKQKAALTRLQTEMTKAGVLGMAHRLAPQVKRLSFTANALRVVDGPFAESKELIGGFSVMELPSEAVAIAEAKRYAEILGGTLEIDLRTFEE
jgi:hypothetical protein